MRLGAVAVLVTGQIGPREALGAIDPDIMLFLFGVFVVGQALEESGYLFHLSYLVFRRAGSADGLILLILFGFGFASAFLMNDTLAVIGTPLVLLLARQHRMSPKVLLLALAAGSTLAGNLFILGAASNVIIIQNAERKGGHSLSFVEFAYVGIPLTLVSVLVYWLFLVSF
jgi:Na+/H+ antiporter NhaD/arsenite permease-like protein